MPRPPYFTPITILASGWLLATAACAAELGDIAVRSFIGQPLSADIELVQLAPDELGTLQVRLAQENVFRGANISMNPALASLHLAIVRREQRQFLRLSTTRPIDAEYVHLFLELGPAGRQEVRAATVWLSADPNPAQRAVPAVSAATPAPAPLPAAPAALVEAAANRSEALPAARPRAAPMPSLHESEIGTPGGLRASVAPPVRRPAAPAKVVPPKAANAANEHDGGHAEASLPLPVAQALLPLPGLPLPKSLKRAPAPAACTPALAGGAKECAALEAHSVELKSKLVELEGKVKVLQGALGAPPAAAKAAPAAASLIAAASASASAQAETPGASHSEAPVGVKGELAKAREAANAAHSAAGSASASASAEAASDSSAAASEVASVPVKKVKVLPKLKYKKEKPPEPAASSKLPLIAAAAAAAVVVLGLAGWLFWRKKRGAAPLKIWQGFRKKKVAEPEVKHEEAPPLEEVTPESLMQ